MRIEVLFDESTFEVIGWNADSKQPGLLKPKLGYKVEVIEGELPSPGFGRYFFEVDRISPDLSTERTPLPDVREEISALKVRVQTLESK